MALLLHEWQEDPLPVVTLNTETYDVWEMNTLKTFCSVFSTLVAVIEEMNSSYRPWMWKTKGKKRKQAKQEVDNVLWDQSLDADRDSRITSSTTSILFY